MAEIFQPPQIPPTFVGGRQPYAPPVRVVQGNSNPSPDADTDVNLAVVLQSWQPDTWPYAFQGGRQPYQGPRQLTPPSGFGEPPSAGLTIVNVIRDYRPFLPGKMNPALMGTAAAVVQPPFSQSWLSAVLQAWQPPDPFPQQRNLTQIVSVDNPPTYADDLADMNQIVSAWQPPDPWPIQRRPTQIVSVDNPPFSHSARSPIMPALLYTWQPPDPQPVQRGPLPAIVLAVRVDNPPFDLYGSNNWVIDVLSSWQPPDPQPRQRPITLPIVGQSRDQPPAITSTQINMLGVIRTWQPPDPWPTQPIYRQRVSVDNPPSFADDLADMYQIVGSWQPPDPWPVQPRYKVVQVSVTYVPFNQAWLTGVIQSWQPPDPFPTQPVNRQRVSVDNPPRITRASVNTAAQIVQSWQPPDPLPWQKPATIRVSVDQPRPRQMAWFATVLQSWQPPDPQPVTSRRNLPVRITAVPVDNPPFDMRRRVQKDIVEAWQPALYTYSRFYTRGYLIPATAARLIDQPSLRGTEPSILLRGYDYAPGLRAVSMAITLTGTVRGATAAPAAATTPIVTLTQKIFGMGLLMQIEG